MANVDSGGHPARAHGRGRRSGSLFEPLGWGGARAPLLSVEAYPAGCARAADDERASMDPRARAALAVGTDDLSGALARSLGAAPAQHLNAKLLRYLIRMTTRPTPFGLFAGVG